MVGIVAMTLLAGVASAATTTVLNPGPGYPTYLGASCGGVHINEGAVDWDADGNAVTRLRAYTSCSTGGLGSKPRRYVACWTVVFATDGTILSRTKYASGTWLQGATPRDCSIDVEVDALYVNDAGVTLGTALFGSGYRAYVETP